MYGATIEALEELGHEALAPPLPVTDEDETPSDHADAVAGAVSQDGELVVVGQSLGAFVAPLVATRVPVTLLVLLAPMIPRPARPRGNGGTTRATARR